MLTQIKPRVNHLSHAMVLYAAGVTSCTLIWKLGQGLEVKSNYTSQVTLTVFVMAWSPSTN